MAFLLICVGFQSCCGVAENRSFWNNIRDNSTSKVPIHILTIQQLDQKNQGCLKISNAWCPTRWRLHSIKKQFVKKLVSSSLVFALFFPREQKINKNPATTHTKQGSTCYQPKYCSMYKGKSIKITTHFRPSPKYVVISTRLQGGPLPVINGVIIPDTHL